MFTKFIVCLFICVTVTVGASASDGLTRNCTSGVDQCHIVEYIVDKMSNQAVELMKCKENLQEAQNSKSNEGRKYQSLNSLYTTLKTQLESFINIAFFSPILHNNKKYYVSKIPYRSANDSDAYCAALGGYLAEIDDDSEYKVLQDLIMGLPVDVVVIAGSDAAVEGRWIFPRTGKAVPVLDWIPGQPNNTNGVEDCLNLWKKYGAKMNALVCGFRKSEDSFMCETPVLDNP